MNNNQEQETLISLKDFKWLVKALAKNWYLFILFPAAFAVVGKFMSYKSVKDYRAQVQILLKSNDVYDYQNSINNNIGIYNAYGDILNQTRILKSYDLIERSLNKLDFDISYFIVGRIRTNEIFNASPFKVDITLLNQSLYEQKIDLRYIDNENFVIELGSDGDKKVYKHQFGKEEITKDYIINVKNLSLISEENKELRSQINYQFIPHAKSYWVNRIIRNMNIVNIDYTSILTISLVDPVSTRAKMFLAALSSEYIEYTLENQLYINDNTQNYIQKQLDNVVEVLDSISDELELMRDQKGILDLNRESQVYFDQLISFETQKRQLDLDINSLDNLKTYVIEANEDKLMPPSFYVLESDPYLKIALTKFYETQSNKIDLSYKVKSNHQELERLQESIGSQKKDILIYVSNTRNAIEEKIRDITKEITHFEELVKKIPKTKRDILSVNRKLEVNEKLYVFLLEKRANTFIAKSGIVPQTKVIEKARILGTVGTSSKNLILMYAFIGICLASFITFIRGLFFSKYENVKDLSENTFIPILGSLPFVKDLTLDIPAKANITEALRGIRTSLSYLNPKENSSLLLVTSVHPGEGKTFTSSRLATIYARSGRRVLLIDFDMHKPKVHKYLNIKNQSGASTILSGNGTIQDSIQQL